MKKFYLSLVFILIPLLFIFGCGDALNDLTTEDFNMDVDVGSFTLTDGGSELTLTALSGNPSCGTATLNSLLASVSDWNDYKDRLDDIEVQNVKYRIQSNTTNVNVSGSLQMTDPNTQQLADVGTASIAANTTVDNWTALPLASGGKAIVQHYIDNRNSTFSFCAEGSPDDATLSMTIQVRLGIKVTVDLL